MGDGSNLARVAGALGERTRASMVIELLGGEALPVAALARAAGVARLDRERRHVARLESRGARDGAARRAASGSSRSPATRSPRPSRRSRCSPASRRSARCAPRTGSPPSAPPAPATTTSRGGSASASATRSARRARWSRGRSRCATPRCWSGSAWTWRPRARRGGRSTRTCLDWSERRPHLAGGLGAALLGSLLARGWVARRPGGRALRVTGAGAAGLADVLGIDAAHLAATHGGRAV